MELRLNIYKDESFTEIKRTCSVDRLRVPYRVAMYVAQMLDKVEDLTDEKQVMKLIASSGDYLTKVVKATFGVSETELECVDIGEMYDVGMELYRYAVERFKSLTGSQDPNTGGPEKN